MYLRTVEGCIKRDHINNEDIMEKLKIQCVQIKHTEKTKLDEIFI
jgi:hypothetical protein